MMPRIRVQKSAKWLKKKKAGGKTGMCSSLYIELLGWVVRRRLARWFSYLNIKKCKCKFCVIKFSLSLCVCEKSDEPFDVTPLSRGLIVCAFFFLSGSRCQTCSLSFISLFFHQTTDLWPKDGLKIAGTWYFLFWLTVSGCDGALLKPLDSVYTKFFIYSMSTQ